MKYACRLVGVNPKLLDDSGEVPKPDGVVGGLIPGHEIVSLLDGKLVKWSSGSCVQNKKRKKKKENMHLDYHLLARCYMIKQHMEEHGEIDVRMVYTLWYLCHIRNSVTYPILRHILGYTNDQQHQHMGQLLTLDVQERLGHVLMLYTKYKHNKVLNWVTLLQPT